MAIPYNPASSFVHQIPATMIHAGIAVASIETANPCIPFVPCPVVEDCASALTGLLFVPV